MQYLRKTEQDWCNSNSGWEIESLISCNNSRQMLPLLPSFESAGVTKELATVFVVLVNPRSIAKIASEK